MIRKVLAHWRSSSSTTTDYIPLSTTAAGTASTSHGTPGTSSKDGGGAPVRWLNMVLILLCVGSLGTVWIATGRTGGQLMVEMMTERLPPPEPDTLDPERCDPFRMPGYLEYNAHRPLDNGWVPFNTHCPRASLLTPLVRSLERLIARKGSPPPSSPLDFELPWLVNRTVVLIGDSIERFHARDFCDLLSATTDPPWHGISENGFTPSPSNASTPSHSFFVSRDYPELKPPRYLYDPRDPDAVPPDWPHDLTRTYQDHHLEWADRDNIRTSPWVCEVPSYGFRVVTVFAFGLEPYRAGAHYSDQDWFITPSTMVDKVQHTLVPLLQNLARERGAPHVTSPDLIEVSAGLWDLRQWSEEDARVANITLDDSTELVYEALSRERLEWWRTRVTKLLDRVHHTFPSPAPIFWRTLHHTRRHSVAPYSRVEQLDQFALRLVRRIQARNDSLAARLKVDSWGHKMLGFEHHFRDAVHPKAVPGSVLWSDMMLWELRRAVSRRSDSPPR
ncbi:hypothetical protein PCANC_22339 [Puccinia coronata f. sp. avenae]|uniref:Uncharacterized protein n=1 Tax=Puccinia coronata f. sp. avenae TaxID=200324 RepID=A0A2N5SAS1_9BASI|nr:hypothetical protein PCANC_22339 [Puccinia coronata f. sp. avenae]PLW48183.1 hypothetical protein PCASD_03305 [Puccinia coronata f. sp. avenae]